MQRPAVAVTGDIADRFREATGREPETIWSAPGRVNLIGEHTDYNDGFVLPFAIDLRVEVAVSRRSDGRIVARSTQSPTASGTSLIGDLDPKRGGQGWLDCPFGVAWALSRHGDIGGFDLLVDGQLPLGSGLSSSAALECAVACAITELFELDLTRIELAVACRAAENEYVGVPSGIMDQCAVLLCRAGNALFLDTRALTSEHVPLDPSQSGCVFLLIDSGVRHSLASSSYTERRLSCETAANRLGISALRDITPENLQAALAVLHDPNLERRVRHVVTENQRVLDTLRLLQHGRLKEVGPLLLASHISLRDDYEVSCFELDLAVESAEQAGALGARMTGGGFGGHAIVLAEASTEKHVCEEVTEAFTRANRPAPTITLAEPSDSARRMSVGSSRVVQ